jgi:hypothetical protein
MAKFPTSFKTTLLNDESSFSKKSEKYLTQIILIKFAVTPFNLRSSIVLKIPLLAMYLGLNTVQGEVDNSK